MREAYDKDWQPMVQVSSKRDGASHTFIYINTSGKDVQFALVVLEDRESRRARSQIQSRRCGEVSRKSENNGCLARKSARGDNQGAVASNHQPRRAPILRALIHHRLRRLRRRRFSPLTRSPGRPFGTRRL